ncbi:Uma2 family endonuclease [Allokutzneria albata]|uniref:Uma2 family endonuclease n=1 Tax=Allokutzneria albata TaxID=211114 RepID=UPI0006948A18|nr:Uma2 family endonuclease [Allokutzneria albata]
MRVWEVVLVGEIVSPDSRRTGTVTKRHEYADAGIPHYWIVDLEQPISLVSCALTEEFGHVDPQETAGVFTATEPFPAEVDLERLRKQKARRPSRRRASCR